MQKLNEREVQAVSGGEGYGTDGGYGYGGVGTTGGFGGGTTYGTGVGTKAVGGSGGGNGATPGYQTSSNSNSTCLSFADAFTTFGSVVSLSCVAKQTPVAAKACAVGVGANAFGAALSALCKK